MTTSGRIYELSICAFQVWTPSGNALPHLRNVKQALEDQGSIYQRTLGRSHRNRAVILPGDLFKAQGCISFLVVVRFAYALLNGPTQIMVILRDTRRLFYLEVK